MRNEDVRQERQAYLGTVGNMEPLEGRFVGKSEGVGGGWDHGPMFTWNQDHVCGRPAGSWVTCQMES